MSSGMDIVVESVWSSPEVSAFYLEFCEIFVQIRNTSNRPIEIQKVECYFQCEDGIEPFVPSITPYLTLDPGHLSNPIRIKFEADVILKSGTNSYRLVIHYVDDVSKLFNYDPRKYLILRPPGPNEKIFFISHKDHEDTYISRYLANFLRKLGFIGYLSEDDHRPGIDLWKEKIPSTITISVAMIILWTNKAAKNPDNIYREIGIAKSCGKRLILAREKGVLVPSDFPKDIEYFPVSRAISTAELKNLACRIEDTYRCGGYSK